MSEKRDPDYDQRAKPGRFSWVKKLLQPKNNFHSSSQPSPKQYRNRNHAVKPALNSQNHNNNTEDESKHRTRQHQNHLRQQEGEQATEITATSSVHSASEPSRIELQGEGIETSIDGSSIDAFMEGSPKQASVNPESIMKADNISTLPVISMSTMSIRSSTFSMNSQQSTSATVTSDHPTLFTNASTVGIPPASIFDRRERSGHQPFSLNSLHYSTHNNSNHTFNTAMSPNSNYAEANDNQ